jgi:methyltransferase-like protein
MELADLPPAVARTLSAASSDSVRLEQYMDFMKVRMFRQPLLCHAEVTVDRAIGPGVVRALAVSSPALSDGQVDPADGARVEFRAHGGAAVTTNAPLLKAALPVLAERWPAAVPFEALLAEAQARVGRDGGDEDRIALAGELLECYLGRVVDLHLVPPPVAADPAERPVASPLARHQASNGTTLVTSLRHRTITLHDEGARRLISLLDGTRDRAALCEAMGEDATPERLDEALRHVARLGLLTA